MANDWVKVRELIAQSLPCLLSSRGNGRGAQRVRHIGDQGHLAGCARPSIELVPEFGALTGLYKPGFGFHGGLAFAGTLNEDYAIASASDGSATLLLLPTRAGSAWFVKEALP